MLKGLTTATRDQAFELCLLASCLSAAEQHLADVIMSGDLRSSSPSGHIMPVLNGVEVKPTGPRPHTNRAVFAPMYGRSDHRRLASRTARTQRPIVPPVADGGQGLVGRQDAEHAVPGVDEGSPSGVRRRCAQPGRPGARYVPVSFEPGGHPPNRAAAAIDLAGDRRRRGPASIVARACAWQGPAAVGARYTARTSSPGPGP